LLFFLPVLCQNASKAVNTRFIIVDGLRRSDDQQTKGKYKDFLSLVSFRSYRPPDFLFLFFSVLTASLWLRVHEQTAQNVHGHERERRPQQQVQQFHQDTGDCGGPGYQLPDLRITGEENSGGAGTRHSHRV